MNMLVIWITSKSSSVPDCFEGVSVSHHPSFLSGDELYDGFILTGDERVRAKLRRIVLTGVGTGIHDGQKVSMVGDSRGREWVADRMNRQRGRIECDVQNIVELEIIPSPKTNELPAYFCSEPACRPVRYRCKIKADIDRLIEFAEARARIAMNPKAYALENTNKVKVERGHWFPVRIGEDRDCVLEVLSVDDRLWTVFLHMLDDAGDIKLGDCLRRKCSFRRWDHAGNTYGSMQAIEVNIGSVVDIL